MQIMPFKESAAWQEQLTLSNIIYILYFKWNALNQYWVMNIYDANAAPLLLGVKVVPNFDLTSPFTVLGLPPGDIVCQNILNQWGPIQRFDMGETCELIYYTPGELEATANT